MYANVRGLKSKLRDTKKILFDIKPDVAAFVETNLKTKEKIAVSGYTWVGKNRQHKEGGGVAILLKTQLKIIALLNQITIQLQKCYGSSWNCYERQENLFIGVLYGKQDNKHCMKELKEEYEVIEKSISNYTETNNKIILVGDFNGKIDNDENGITNGNISITTNGKKIRSMVRTLNLDILNKHAKMQRKMDKSQYQK